MIINHPPRCLSQEHRSFFKVRRAAKITRDAWFRGLFKNLKKISLALQPSCKPQNVLQSQIQEKAGKAFYKNWLLWTNRWMCVTNHLTFWRSSNLPFFSLPLNAQCDFLFPSPCNTGALFNQPATQNSLPLSLLLLPMQCLYSFCCFFPKGHYKQLFEQQT